MTSQVLLVKSHQMCLQHAANKGLECEHGVEELRRPQSKPCREFQVSFYFLNSNMADLTVEGPVDKNQQDFLLWTVESPPDGYWKKLPPLWPSFIYSMLRMVGCWRKLITLFWPAVGPLCMPVFGSWNIWTWKWLMMSEWINTVHHSLDSDYLNLIIWTEEKKTCQKKTCQHACSVMHMDELSNISVSIKNPNTVSKSPQIIIISNLYTPEKTRLPGRMGFCKTQLVQNRHLLFTHFLKLTKWNKWQWNLGQRNVLFWCSCDKVAFQTHKYTHTCNLQAGIEPICWEDNTQ